MNTHASTRKILVIDNDEGLVQAVTTRLEAHGYSCVTANNGEEGLSAFSACEIGLIITDLNMPALDGIGFVDRIRSSSSSPIIIMTGFSDQYRQQLRRIPNAVVLQKPFETQVLLDLVEVELAQSIDRLAG